MAKTIFWIVFIILIIEIPLDIILDKYSWKKRLTIVILLIIALFISAYFASLKG